MLNIGNKVFRNLPEQVAENVRQISKLWEQLDGLDVFDNVVILENLDPLSPEDLEVLNKPVSFIVYNDELYMKKIATASDIYFDKVLEVSETSGTITFVAGEIAVAYPLGTVTLSSDSFLTYSKDQIDTLLNDKVDKTDLYPVGAIYISTDSTSPASLFGGTWTALNSGNLIDIPLGNAPIKATADMNDNVGSTHFIKSNGTSIGSNTDIYLNNYGNLLAKGNSVSDPSGRYNIAMNNLWAVLTSALQVYMWERVS